MSRTQIYFGNRSLHGAVVHNYGSGNQMDGNVAARLAAEARARDLYRLGAARDLIAMLGFAFAMSAVFFRWSGLGVEDAAPVFGVLAGVILLNVWYLERRVQRLTARVVTDRLVA